MRPDPIEKEDERLRRRRQMNKEAAARCRQQKLYKINSLQEQLNAYKVDNDRKEKEKRILMHEIDHLRHYLQFHDCHLSESERISFPLHDAIFFPTHTFHHRYPLHLQQLDFYQDDRLNRRISHYLPPPPPPLPPVHHIQFSFDTINDIHCSDMEIVDDRTLSVVNSIPEEYPLKRPTSLPLNENNNNSFQSMLRTPPFQYSNHFSSQTHEYNSQNDSFSSYNPSGYTPPISFSTTSALVPCSGFTPLPPSCDLKQL